MRLGILFIGIEIAIEIGIDQVFGRFLFYRIPNPVGGQCSVIAASLRPFTETTELQEGNARSLPFYRAVSLQGFPNRENVLHGSRLQKGDLIKRLTKAYGPSKANVYRYLHDGEP